MIPSEEAPSTFNDDDKKHHHNEMRKPTLTSSSVDGCCLPRRAAASRRRRLRTSRRRLGGHGRDSERPKDDTTLPMNDAQNNEHFVIRQHQQLTADEADNSTNSK